MFEIVAHQLAFRAPVRTKPNHMSLILLVTMKFLQY